MEFMDPIIPVVSWLGSFCVLSFDVCVWLAVYAANNDSKKLPSVRIFVHFFFCS
uniref:Uncharacterized protein n=1 Tax=Anguilla anguilla TaxID=7936 RepID=A0A0E9USP1_ANGAN